MNKKELLKDFLMWLSEEGVARWYSIEEEYGGRGEDNIIKDYLDECEEESYMKGNTEGNY